MKNESRAGFAAILGRPNVGKSSLLNRLVGEKIAITSDKPQTTRNRIMGILTKGETQIVFVDTPGLLLPRNKLGAYMKKSAEGAMQDVDIIIMVVEADEKIHPAEEELLSKLFLEGGAPAVLVINKTDKASPALIAKAINAYKDYDFKAIIPMSAKTGDGAELLLKELFAAMPEGPFYFPDDSVTDQPERVMAAEMIREKALSLLDKEIPHGIAVTIESFKEKENIIEISADIVCERASHKGIIIGKGGAMLKNIGSLARKDMEELLGKKVFLTLFVKIKEKWRDSASLLKNFGYDE